MNPKNSTEKSELDQINDFVPYYVLGNLCIGSKYMKSALITTQLTRTLHSLGILLERKPPRHLQHLRHYQHLRSSLLLRLPPRQDEHKLNLFHTHPRRRQDLRWYRCP